MEKESSPPPRHKRNDNWGVEVPSVEKTKPRFERRGFGPKVIPVGLEGPTTINLSTKSGWFRFLSGDPVGPVAYGLRSSTKRSKYSPALA